MKRRWKVSIAAMIRRSFTLGLKEALELEEYRHVLKLDAEKSGCENADWRVCN